MVNGFAYVSFIGMKDALLVTLEKTGEFRLVTLLVAAGSVNVFEVNSTNGLLDLTVLVGVEQGLNWGQNTEKVADSLVNGEVSALIDFVVKLLDFLLYLF